MNLTVVMKTFLRPACCVASVRSWLRAVPGIPIVVVDDGGDVSPDLAEFPTVRHIRTEFDIGISAGRNVGIEAAGSRYIILADDDNACTADSDVPAALAQLQERGLAVLGVGAFWFRIHGGCLRISGVPAVKSFARCDATLNHFVGDRERMPKWDARFKMAGEHVDYFLECRRQGAAVGATPLLGFEKTLAEAEATDPRYRDFRARGYGWLVRKKWKLRAVGRWINTPEAQV